MFDYTGYECKSCGKEFTEDDDIVVCPECGTPYHRECYKNEGGCINKELHDNGVSWKAEKEAEKAAEKAAVKCRNCGKSLSDEQFFCDHCGTPTDALIRSRDEADTGASVSDFANDTQRRTMEAMHPFMVNYSDPLCGFNPDEQYTDEVTLRDVGDFVKTNTHYYLPKFRLMKSIGFKISMNFSAMIFPELFFANRKMPLFAMLVLVLKTIISIPSSAVSMQWMLEDEYMLSVFRETMPFTREMIDRLMNLNLESGSFGTLINITNLASWVLIFVLASFSNYFYYKHVLNKAAKVKKEAVSSGKNVSEALRQNGGTSGRLLALFIVLYIISAYAAMGAVFLLI